MMYKEMLVTTIRCKGKILREHGDTVYLPFGSEYSIFLKNINTCKALVDITVDGREVISDLIINPGQKTEIERFFEGSMNCGHKLKFIEKTKQIEEYRGNKIEDGIVQIKYRFEKSTQVFHDYIHEPVFRSVLDQRLGSPGLSYQNYTSSNMWSHNRSNVPVASSAVNDQGITVEGNDSSQSFRYGDIGPLESTTHSIIIQLKGEVCDGFVDEPLTVKTKLRCNYCGTVSGSRAKFCAECGAALI